MREYQKQNYIPDESLGESINPNDVNLSNFGTVADLRVFQITNVMRDWGLPFTEIHRRAITAVRGEISCAETDSCVSLGMMAAPPPLRKREPAMGWLDESPSRKSSWRWMHRKAEGKTSSHYIGKKKHLSRDEAWNIFVQQSWIWATNPPGDVTVFEMWERFLIEALHGADSTTLRDFSFAGKHIFVGLGPDTLIRNLDFGYLTRFKIGIWAKFSNTHTRSKIITCANRFLDHVSAHGILDTNGNRWVNTLHFVKLPQNRKRKEKGWTPDTPIARALCFAIWKPFNLCWKLSCTTSVGPAELFGLRVWCLNLSDEEVERNGEVLPPRSMLINEDWNDNMYKPLKTDVRWRKLPLPDCLIADLRAHVAALRYQGPNDPVFGWDNKGKPIPRNRYNFNTAMKAAAKTVAGASTAQCYGGRRFFATQCDALHVDIEDTAFLMGHSDGHAMTRRYQVRDVERRRWIVNKIAEKLGI